MTARTRIARSVPVLALVAIAVAAPAARALEVGPMLTSEDKVVTGQSPPEAIGRVALHIFGKDGCFLKDVRLHPQMKQLWRTLRDDARAAIRTRVFTPVKAKTTAVKPPKRSRPSGPPSPATICEDVSVLNSTYNMQGQVLYSFLQTVHWCWNVERITYPYETANVIQTSWGWTFDQWIEQTTHFDPVEFDAYRQAQFKLSGAVQLADWIGLNLTASGLAYAEQHVFSDGHPQHFCEPENTVEGCCVVGQDCNFHWP
jgi:hypothetical protein